MSGDDYERLKLSKVELLLIVQSLWPSYPIGHTYKALHHWLNQPIWSHIEYLQLAMFKISSTSPQNSPYERACSLSKGWENDFKTPIVSTSNCLANNREFSCRALSMWKLDTFEQSPIFPMLPFPHELGFCSRTMIIVIIKIE
jgi:hypothetical protein